MTIVFAMFASLSLFLALRSFVAWRHVSGNEETNLKFFPGDFMNDVNGFLRGLARVSFSIYKDVKRFITNIK